MHRTLTALTTAALLASGPAAASAAPAPTPPAQQTASGWTTVTAGAPKPRTAIPWAAVGRGWSVMTVVPPSGTPRLMLFSPAGQGYTVTSVGRAVGVEEVGLDGRTAILVDYVSSKRWVVELATGRQHRPVPATVEGLARPRATGVVTTTWSSDAHDARPTGIQLRDLDGRVLRRSTTRAAAVHVMPDGRTWVAEVDGQVRAIEPRTLRPTRRYAVPAGYRACSVAGVYDRTSFVEQCRPSKGAEQLFVQRVTGGAPVRKTWGTPAGAAEAFSDVVPAAKGDIAFAVRQPDEHLVLRTAYRMTGTKSSRIMLPRGYEGSYNATTAVGSRLYLMAAGDVQPVDVAAVDLDTRRIVRFVGRGTKTPGLVNDMKTITGR